VKTRHIPLGEFTSNRLRWTVALLLILALPLLTGCPANFDPGNQGQVDSLAAKVRAGATVAAGAFNALDAKSVPAVVNVLNQVRAVVGTEPVSVQTAQAAANVALNQLVANGKLTEPTAKQISAITATVLSVAACYIPIPPDGSAKATALLYAKVGQRLTLAAIDGALGALPNPNGG
jgi:hypothetical protein